MEVIVKKLLVVLAFALTLGQVASAHEGHGSKVMGTVTAISSAQLQVTTAPGKVSTIVLNDKTKIMKGKSLQKATDIHVGDRIVVAVKDVKGQDGKGVRVAQQVNLATSPGAKK
ncbi:MAG: hypothetical protein ABIS06_04700 [Vicinamibacterales bacterium]